MAANSGQRRLTPEDIYQIALVSDAQIAPDGSEVVFVRTSADEATDGYRSSLYLVEADGGPARRLTMANARDTSPRWSPSGDAIAFLSTRSGSNQVWTIPVAGGEAAQLTEFPEAVSALAWTPDGRTIACVSKTESHQPEIRSAEQQGETAKAGARAESDVRLITKIRFRADGTPGFIDHDKHNHIWCVPLSGGAPWQVTSGDYDDRDPSWAADGREIFFSSNRSPGREYNSVSEIWAVEVEGGDARPVVSGERAHFFAPICSPDGEQVAMIGHDDPPSEGATNECVWLLAEPNGEPRNLTATLDRSSRDVAATDTSAGSNRRLVWSASRNRIYFPVADAGSVHLYSADPATGQLRCVIGGARRVLDFSLSADGNRLAFTAGAPLNPCDIYVCNADGSEERRLTSVNAGFFESVALSTPEEFWLDLPHDTNVKIQGWVMKPIGFEAGKRYPAVLEIHGGPHAMYAHTYVHEFQLLAAQGYVVIYANPRGSQGYGEAFTKYIHAAWCEKDMPDLMAVVDHVVDQGYVDSERLGITGGSYGGQMTNWVIGHTDRFKAAVTQRSVSNLTSFFGTSDIGFAHRDYDFGLPWIERERYIRLSPITYVEDITTPLLIIHSEQDYRCPIEQAEQLFVSLKKLGRTVEFARFPNESHGLSRSGKPKHRVERLRLILGWFARYL